MNRTSTPVLIFLAVGVSVPAQQPTPGAAPAALFSAEVIKSFTPADNEITDAKAKLGDMIFDEKRLSIDNSIAAIPATHRATVSPPTPKPRVARAIKLGSATLLPS